MVGVGEETGALDTMLTKIADFYEDQVDAAVKQLTSILEPVMIVARRRHGRLHRDLDVGGCGATGAAGALAGPRARVLAGGARVRAARVPRTPPPRCC